MNDEQGKRSSKSKKRFKIRYLAGGLALIIGAFAWYLNKTGKLEELIKQYWPFGNGEKNSVMEIADSLPLDEDGVISITFPVVDRKIDSPEGLYSLPNGYSPYSIMVEDGEATLAKVTDSTKNGVNVTNYQSSNGGTPTGFIGVEDKYSEFLTEVEKIKEGIKDKDGGYTSMLTAINYEVPNLYYLASGYELYCEDETIMSQAKLAYVLDDGSKIFSIPSNLISNFIGVSADVCDVIVKYDYLRNQIIEVYQSNPLGVNNDETTNRGR